MVPPCSVKITRVPTYLSQAQYHSEVFVYGAITLYCRTFQTVPLTKLLSLAGCSQVARRYCGDLSCFLFLWLLRCFSSPGSPPTPMDSVQDTPKGGFPHSEISGSKSVCRLPEAFRRLQRPSSPLTAKASTVCA